MLCLQEAYHDNGGDEDLEDVYDCVVQYSSTLSTPYPRIMDLKT